MPIDENHARLTANYHLSNKRIIFKNFIGGIAWGVGSIIGATLIVAFLLGILQFINFIPFVGDFVTQVVEYVESRKFPIN